MKDRKHIKTFEDKTSELNISDVISSKTKEEILKLIKSLDDRGYFYIFNNREDFVEGRTDWDDLKDTCENFYYVIENIKELIERNE